MEFMILTFLSLQAGLARLLRSTSADDDHGGVLAVFVGALGHAGAGRGPDNTMVEVHDVALELLLVDVDDGQVVNGALVDQSVCVGDSDIAGADEYYFVSNMISHGPYCAPDVRILLGLRPNSQVR